MRFFPGEKGKTAFVEGFSLTSAFSLSRVGNSHLAGGRKSGLTNWCAFGPQGWCLYRKGVAIHAYLTMDARFYPVLGWGLAPV